MLSTILFVAIYHIISELLHIPIMIYIAYVLWAVVFAVALIDLRYSGLNWMKEKTHDRY